MYSSKSISYSKGLSNYDTDGKCKPIKKPDIVKINQCDNGKTYIVKNAKRKEYKSIGEL
jgi:hypothetical protein